MCPGKVSRSSGLSLLPHQTLVHSYWKSGMEKNTSLQILPGSLLSLISTTTLEVNDRYMDKPRKRDEYWVQG